jgi:hypothetical protein
MAYKSRSNHAPARNMDQARFDKIFKKEEYDRRKETKEPERTNPSPKDE